MGNKKTFSQGFTLIEMLVAVAVFSLAVASVSTTFISAIKAQRHSLANQEILDQTSYAVEYMSRAIRMAKKELSTPPNCFNERGCNYESENDSHIRFINHNRVCTEFVLEDGLLKEKKNGDFVGALISPNLTISSFNVKIDNPCQNVDAQPLVIIELKVEGEEGASIEIKTSISQRDLNVKR